MRILVAISMSCWAVAAVAGVVHVREVSEVAGEIAQISDRLLETGRRHVTQAAPGKSGYAFTHWSMSTDQALVSRDAWGRACDAVEFDLYEETVLTAHYLALDVDTDNDGLPDGKELYWYGNLEEGPTSDTDGDGKTLVQELASGTNPLVAERHVEGPVSFADGAQWLFNPSNYAACVIRSEPEDALFETTTEIMRPGVRVLTPAQNPSASTFAYWTVNGVRACDDWGRAADALTLDMTADALEIVAVCEADADARMKMYWYGTTDVAMTDDTDGDGKTLAQEIAAGTNPLVAERHVEGPVKTADGSLWLYNPSNYPTCVIRSEPEGALFATTSAVVRPDDLVRTPVCDVSQSAFAYWTVDGVRAQDVWGRALDEVQTDMTRDSLELVAVTEPDQQARLKLYWYGTTEISATADTDGDGKTFAQEVASGTNPLVPERHEEGPVQSCDTELHEVDVQHFLQAEGALLDGDYIQLFTSAYAKNAGESIAFGTQGLQKGGVTDVSAVPLVADVNGDGLFDVIVVSATATTVLVNVGKAGDPQFRVGTDAEARAVRDETLEMNSTAKLAGLALDVPAPADALSCAFGDADQDGVADLLVSDAEGRIWYYLSAPVGEGADGTVFVLQHKVWGGTYAGFAEGLRIAAVDWDDDGDLDCLCGTAEGKLMLLVDPGAGRPTGLVADAGVDSVNLAWNVSRQSRVRGYNVYRADEKAKVEGERWSAIDEAELPNYRDVPEREGTYAYRVTALSRNYVAGNSEPVVTESKPSEAVSVDFGTAQFAWRLSEEPGGIVAAQLIVRNSSGLGGALQLEVGYDPAVLTPTAAMFAAGAIAPQFRPSVTPAGAGRLVVSGSLGAVEPDQRGVFFTLRFARVAGGDLAAANLTVGSFAIETEGHATKIELGDTTDGGGGDVNGDGAVDQADVSRMTELIRKPADAVDPAALKAGDLNGDGRLDAKDLVLLKRKVAGK